MWYFLLRFDTHSDTKESAGWSEFAGIERLNNWNLPDIPGISTTLYSVGEQLVADQITCIHPRLISPIANEKFRVWFMV